jgi:predicted DNA-binding helix-hairpin-helix protein
MSCVEEACKLASRVSINIEAPTPEHLATLATGKELDRGILEAMRLVKRIRERYRGRAPAGQTTQFVVGAANETDKDILHASHALYKDLGLNRIFFSAYHPIPGSRLEHIPAAPPMREHRLYQSEWLLRVYRFSMEDIDQALTEGGDLDIAQDPKMVIAKKQPWLFPIDVNDASYRQLLRIPGIGPTSARRIVQAREEHTIRSLGELGKLGCASKRAAPFLWLKDMETESRNFAVQVPLFA